MSLELISLITETFGTLMIAFAALRVHHRVLHEHKIDQQVMKIMKWEQILGVVGALLVITSFIIDSYLLV